LSSDLEKAIRRSPKEQVENAKSNSRRCWILLSLLTTASEMDVCGKIHAEAAEFLETPVRILV